MYRDDGGIGGRSRVPRALLGVLAVTTLVGVAAATTTMPRHDHGSNGHDRWRTRRGAGDDGRRRRRLRQDGVL